MALLSPPKTRRTTLVKPWRGLGPLLSTSGWGRGGEFRHPLAGRVLALSDAGHQVVGTAESVFAGRSLQVGFLDFLQRDTVFVRFFFDQFLSNFDGALALVDGAPVLALVACAPRLADAGPV